MKCQTRNKMYQGSEWIGKEKNFFMCQDNLKTALSFSLFVRGKIMVKY
jgi:hypothetical protein